MVLDPHNRFMRQAVIADPREDALRYLARRSRPEEYSPDDRFLGLPEHEYRELEAFYAHGDARFNTDVVDEFHAQN